MDQGAYTFRVKLVNNEAIILSKSDQADNQVHVNVKRNEKDKIRLRKQCFIEFDEFINGYLSDILNVCATEKQMNTTFSLNEKLIESTQRLCLQLLKEKCSSFEFEKVESVIKQCFVFVQEKQSAYKTSKLRLRELKKNPKYVQPKKKVMNIKWKTKADACQNIPSHTLVQTTFEYVPLLETIKSLSSDPEFAKQYFAYNNEKHMSNPGNFKDFCCGEIFRNSDLFKNYPDALQIELSIDDFEVCSPLKSKATLHKVCGVYFRIRNTPPEFNSKLQNIYSLAFCETVHLKPDDCSINDVLQHFVKELKVLETNGLGIFNGKYLKGTLINTSHDNLGGNGMLGYVECFSTD